MNKTILIQIMVYILLRCTAGAASPASFTVTPQDRLQHEQISGESFDTMEQGHAAFAQKMPQREDRKYRSRARGILFFTATFCQQADKPNPFAGFALNERLYCDNKTLILPFYYIFLFRLTLF